jgi:hypothetical protein
MKSDSEILAELREQAADDEYYDSPAHRAKARRTRLEQRMEEEENNRVHEEE